MADQRLVATANQTGTGALLVRAKVVGDAPIVTVEVKVGDADAGWATMAPAPGQHALSQARGHW